VPIQVVGGTTRAVGERSAAGDHTRTRRRAARGPYLCEVSLEEHEAEASIAAVGLTVGADVQEIVMTRAGVRVGRDVRVFEVGLVIRRGVVRPTPCGEIRVLFRPIGEGIVHAAEGVGGAYY